MLKKYMWYISLWMIYVVILLYSSFVHSIGYYSVSIITGFILLKYYLDAISTYLFDKNIKIGRNEKYFIIFMTIGLLVLPIIYCSCMLLEYGGYNIYNALGGFDRLAVFGIRVK